MGLSGISVNVRFRLVLKAAETLVLSTAEPLQTETSQDRERERKRKSQQETGEDEWEVVEDVRKW